MYKIIVRGAATNGVVTWSFYKEFGQEFATNDVDKASNKYTTLLNSYGRDSLKLIDEVDMDILVNAVVDCDCSKNVDLNQMIANAAAGSTIVLSSDISTTESIIINKDITIDGGGYKIVYKGTQMTTGAVIVQDDSNVILNNIIVDPENKTRAIMSKGGSLTLNNVSIINNVIQTGMTAGIVATGNSKTTLNNCTVTGNQNEVLDIRDQYASDLWFGANAIGIINGGTYNNVFVNANAFSATEKGNLTVEAGTIDNLWLEYAENYGADLTITGGDIEKLYIANKNGGDEAMMVLNNPVAGKYEGGTGIINNETPENSSEK